MTVLFKCPFFTKKEKAGGSSKENMGISVPVKKQKLIKGWVKMYIPWGYFDLLLPCSCDMLITGICRGEYFVK